MLEVSRSRTQVFIMPWQSTSTLRDLPKQQWRKAPSAVGVWAGCPSGPHMPDLQEEAEMPGMCLIAMMSQVTGTPGFKTSPWNSLWGKEQPWLSPALPDKSLNCSPAVPKPCSLKHHLDTPLGLFLNKHFPLCEETEPTQAQPDRENLLCAWPYESDTRKKSLCA